MVRDGPEGPILQGKDERDVRNHSLSVELVEDPPGYLVHWPRRAQRGSAPFTWSPSQLVSSLEIRTWVSEGLLWEVSGGHQVWG